MSTTPWHNDHPLKPNQVRALLTQQFPELAVAQVHRLSEGWDNVTWLIHNTQDHALLTEGLLSWQHITECLDDY